MSLQRSKSIKSSISSDAELCPIPSFSSPSSKSIRTNQSFRPKVLRKNLSRTTNDSSLDLSRSSSFFITSQTSSKIFQIRNPVIQSKKASLYRSKPMLSDDLESKILEIEEISRSVGITSEVFESCQEIFAKIIEKSGKHKNILEKIRYFYGTWIKTLANFEKPTNLVDHRLQDLNKKLESALNENMNLIKKLKKLSEENSRFGREKENAREEFDHIFQSCEFNSNEDSGNDANDIKRQIALGFKIYVDQTFQDVKNELNFYQNIEKTAYKIFNILLQNGYPIEKMMKGSSNTHILERWNYFKQNSVLKPHQQLPGFFMNMTCGSSELITFGDDRSLNELSGINKFLV